MVDRTLHALSEDENERIFRAEIVPDELVGTPQRRPVVVFVAGQTGAGKTSVTNLVERSLSRRGDPVNINLDTYKPHHPRYQQLVADDETTAGAYTSIDGHKWMERAEAHAIAQRFDVVMESAMRDPRDFEEPARRFKAAGYHVEVAVVAVHASLSRLGALDRYLQQVEDFGRGRLIDPQIHDACYDGVLRSADAIDAEGFADRVFVMRRDGHVVYGNARSEDGRWQRPAATRAAIDSERNRPWTAQETHRYLHSVQRVQGLVRRLGDPPTQLAAMAEEAKVASLAQPLMHPDVVTMHRATAGTAARGQLTATPGPPRRTHAPPTGPSLGRD